MFTIQRAADGSRHGVPSQPSESEDYFAFFDPHFHGLGLAAAGQAARSRRGPRLSKGIAPAVYTLGDQQRRRPASVVTKAAAAAFSPQGGGGERVPEEKPGAVSFQKRGWGRWEIGSVCSEAWAWLAGTRGRRWCFFADAGDCSIPAPNSPSRPLVAVEQAESAALASHQKKKKGRKSG